MKRLLLFCVAAVVILFFQGCASKPVSAPLSEQVGSGGGMEEQRQRGLGQSQAGRGGGVTEEDLAKNDEARRRAASMGTKVGESNDIFFEFDSYTVRSEDLPVLQSLAEQINGDRAASVTIEGHCDERGTTEYNLALGQKRAEAAKEYLVKLGVSGKRIKTISYGKEAPFQPGHSEADWAKNRRDHFTVK